MIRASSIDSRSFNLGDQKPLIIISPGITSDQMSYYVRNIVELSCKEGFEVVVINHRGLAGAKLATPKMYCQDSSNDLLEAMNYVYEQYCKKWNRKVFAIGCSMGANLLANALGDQGDLSFIEAACVI